MRRRWVLLLLLAWTSVVRADSFPTRAVKIIVPFGPGTGSDVLARAIGIKLSESFGQPVTVENREGAGGLIGTRALLALPADGHSMLLAANVFVVSPLLYDKPPYDPMAQFAPVARVASVPVVLIAGPSTPFRHVRDVLAHAKANPGTLTFASSGKGTPSQLEMEYLKAAYDVQMTDVPYKNQAQAISDLIGGQVDLYYPTLMAAMPHIKSGRVRALALGGAKRSALAPEIPTMAEALDAPGYEAHTWYGFVVAAGTPEEALRRLRTDIQKALQSKDVVERVSALGGEIAWGNGEVFAHLMRSERDKWSKLIKRIGLRAD